MPSSPIYPGHIREIGWKLGEDGMILFKLLIIKTLWREGGIHIWLQSVANEIDRESHLQNTPKSTPFEN
jgi:hypothetical protein